MRKAGIVLSLLAVAALPLSAVPSAARTAAPAAAKTVAKKAPVAAKATTSDDPDAPVETIVPPSQAALDAAGWRIIDDPATGARLGLPSALVPKTAPARIGSRWMSGRGTIDIETFRLHEGALAALFDDEKKVRHRTVEHSTLAADSFVMSGMQNLKHFIVRAQAIGGELRGVTILYDQATEGIMAPIAAAMANTFQGFPDPAAAPPGMRRSAEYGSAVVISKDGYLVTASHVVSDCQTITIPGFGHAERIAADRANDIALLRLYGAQNLSPASLSGDSATGDDLTLVGVADPSAQAGAGALSRVPAHNSAQGLDPAPKLGFAGAAAIDGQGRFAGMVELKAIVVAGAAATTQATLVPADTLRAFLQAQNVTPAGGNAAIDQSVVRVICVRK
jgi:S1-C subfamily serine protease